MPILNLSSFIRLHLSIRCSNYGDAIQPSRSFAPAPARHPSRSARRTASPTPARAHAHQGLHGAPSVETGHLAPYHAASSMAARSHAQPMAFRHLLLLQLCLLACALVQGLVNPFPQQGTRAVQLKHTLQEVKMSVWAGRAFALAATTSVTRQRANIEMKGAMGYR
eukprot:6121731-Pleurochrysis_carterae.AAC.1